MTSLETARNEAIAWSLSLRDADGDDAVVEAFLRWLEDDETNAQAWGEIERLRLAATDDADLRKQDATVFDGAEPQEPARKKPTNIAPSGRRSRRSRYMPVGIAAAILLLLGILNYDAIRVGLLADYVAPTGQVERITLPDGSTVDLGAGSALALDFTEKSRRVDLLRGIAFFEVTPDASRPFNVKSGSVSVSVTGTAFEVRDTPGGAVVSVQTGDVQVSSSGVSGETANLSAGEALRAEAGRSVRGGKSQIRQDEIAAWRRGKLIANNWPAQEVFEVLKRQFKGTVISGAWSFGESRLTGVYDLKEPEKALRIFAATQRLRIIKPAPGIVFLSPI